MKLDASRQIDRFRGLEPVWQWVLGACVFLLAFLIWAQILDPSSTAWAETADRMESNLERTSNSVSLDARSQNAALTYGSIVLPDRKADGSLALIEIVQDILSRHGVKNDTFYQAQSNTIKASVLPGIAQAGEKIERVKGELDFSSSAGNAIQIISELESHPGIESVTNIRIDKAGNKQVRTRISLEAWVRSR
jgi:hypothetical protein